MLRALNKVKCITQFLPPKMVKEWNGPFKGIVLMRKSRSQIPGKTFVMMHVQTRARRTSLAHEASKTSQTLLHILQTFQHCLHFWKNHTGLIALETKLCN